MLQAKLIEDLKIAESTFRKWRGLLGITPKDIYSPADVEAFQRLRDLTLGGAKLDEAVAQVLGKPSPKQQGNGSYRDALVKRYGDKLEKEAATVGNALAQAFDSLVWGEFVNALASSKPTNFEKALENFSVSSNADILDGEIIGALEGGEDAA